MTVMVTWRDFEFGAPDIAAMAVMLWPGITALNRGEPKPPGAPWFRVAFLATARRDGSPRLHPFCPVLATGRLLAAIPRASPKGDDLRRDPRRAIHALPGLTTTSWPSRPALLRSATSRQSGKRSSRLSGLAGWEA